MVSLFPADNPTDRVYGVAYEIRDDLWQQSVEGQLDHREKGGYSQRKVVFHASDDGDELSEVVTVYIGKKDDPQYAGPDDLEVMARTIATSVGPSGRNIDYLYNLASGLREMKIEDEHVKSLEDAVRKVDAENKSSS